MKLIKKGESYGSGKMETKLGIHSNEILQGIRRAGAKDIGLGLVVCIRLVEAHGGRTWVEPKWGEGSTFLFTIPQIKEKKAQR